MMPSFRPAPIATLVTVVFVTLRAAGPVAAQAPAGRTPDPETVLVTYHVKAGGEAAFAKILDAQWKTMRDLALVGEGPHVLMTRDGDPAHPTFIELFTWKDRDIPDHAPEAVQKLWQEMSRWVEARGVLPPIDITEVRLVRPE